MLLVSLLSGLSSLSSEYKYLDIIIEGNNNFYLYDSTCLSNTTPHLSWIQEDEEDRWYILKGASFVVEGDSIEACFKEANKTLDIQQQIFHVFPTANFSSKIYHEDYNCYINNHGFSFEFEYYVDVHPSVFVDSSGIFNWYFRYQGIRVEGTTSSISMLDFSIKTEIKRVKQYIKDLKDI